MLTELFVIIAAALALAGCQTVQQRPSFDRCCHRWRCRHRHWRRGPTLGWWPVAGRRSIGAAAGAHLNPAPDSDAPPEFLSVT